MRHLIRPYRSQWSTMRGLLAMMNIVWKKTKDNENEEPVDESEKEEDCEPEEDEDEEENQWVGIRNEVQE